MNQPTSEAPNNRFHFQRKQQQKPALILLRLGQCNPFHH